MRSCCPAVGVISGLIAGAFGLGGFIFNPVGSFIFNPNGLSLGKDEKLLPCSVTDNFGPSLRKMASIYFLVALAAVPLIRLPKQQEASGGSSVGQQAMSVRDVLRTPAFWIMWLTTALASQGALYIGSTYKAIAMGRSSRQPQQWIVSPHVGLALRSHWVPTWCL